MSLPKLVSWTLVTLLLGASCVAVSVMNYHILAMIQHDWYMAGFAMLFGLIDLPVVIWRAFSKRRVTLEREWGFGFNIWGIIFLINFTLLLLTQPQGWWMLILLRFIFFTLSFLIGDDLDGSEMRMLQFDAPENLNTASRRPRPPHTRLLL